MAREASLRVVFGIAVLDLIGFGILIPQLGVYGVRFGASPFAVGLLVAVYSLMQLVAAPIMGRLSDRFGRRPVLLISQVGSLLGYVLFAFAHTLPLLFLSRVIDGVSGGNVSTAQAVVADITKPHERARGMGIIGAAFGLGFVLGPALGGVLGAWGGNLAIGLFAAGLSALNLINTWFFLPETRRADSPSATTRSMRGAAAVLTLPVVGRCVVLVLLYTVAFAQMEGTFSVYLLTRFLSSGPVPLEGGWLVHAVHPDAAVLKEASLRSGALFAVVGVLSALVQGGLVRRLVAAHGAPGQGAEGAPGGRGGREAPVAVVGFGLTAAGLALLPVAPSYGWLFPVMGLLAVGSALVTPCLSALVSLHAPMERQGAVLGAYQASGSLGRIIGPALGGLLFTRLGPTAPYGTGAVLVALGGLLALSLVTQVRMSGAGAEQSS
ncbi:putative multidrug resistance protein [Corallococcus coralloides DSM 2259]|uniref:Putative multidrug resistance protein n=4 Tax=Corallococcus TaxID=83461 RepID=H8N0P2_CORCM|nr:MFS transporter [Corallococcus coralloides]AFE08007.1 putative multidrug resistance protein [Corallococcus coralloides DSM 2259]